MSIHVRRLLAFWFAVGMFVPWQGAAAPVLDISHVREHALSNGLHIIVKEEQGWGTVAIGTYIRAGSLYDPPEAPGTAHFVEHMLFRTGERGGEPSELVSTIEGQGGQINAETNRDSVVLQIVTSPQSLPVIWPLLARTLFEPRFTEEAVNEEKKVITQEIAEREGDAFNTLADEVWAVAYPTHPYGRRIGGTRESVAAITVEGVRDFHSRFYVPNNIAIILVGDVRAADVFAQIQQAFSSYPQQPIHWEAPPGEVPVETSKTEVQTRPVSMALIGLGFRGPGIANKRDVCAMDLIYTILSEGRNCRLARNVRDAGLIVAFDLQFITQKEDGLVLLTAAAEPTKELEARNALMQEFERLATEPLSSE
ncbi:MAG: M16 family metallopeptidase, partial [Candidatus Zipacnadales bacterium]